MAPLLFVTLLAILFTDVDASTTQESVFDPTQLPTEATTSGPLEYSCSVEDTLGHTCLMVDDYTWERSRYCHCDPLCVSYGDCCPDYAEGTEMTTVLTPDEASTVANGIKVGVDGPPQDEFTKCVQTIELNPRRNRPRRGHYLVAVCPHDWSGDSAIRNFCHDTPEPDGIAAIPVEGADGRHYKNVYCALCHGLPFANVTFWSVSYKEKEYSAFNNFRIFDISPEVRKGVTKMVNPPGYFGTDGFSAHLMASSLRTCIILDPITCPFSSPETQATCDHYLAPIALNGTTYKNLACLQCNNSVVLEKAVRRLWCTDLSENVGGSAIGIARRSMLTLLLFPDITRAYGGGVLGEAPCADNQVFDPYIDLCRDLFCPDGFVLKDGLRCVEVTANDPVGGFCTAVALTVSVNLLDGSTTQNPNSIGMWEAIVTQVGEDYQSRVCGNLEDDHQGHIDCNEVNLTWACSMGADVFLPACGTGDVFNCRVNLSFNSNMSPGERFIEESKTIPGRCFRGGFWQYTIRIDNIAISAPCGTAPNETGQFFVPHNDSRRQVDCILLTFSEDEYIMTGPFNDSIRLTQYDRVLQRGEYQLHDNGEAEVCTFLQAVTSIPDDAWNNAHFILTVSGTSLSLIGVIVTIVTYIAFPTLRHNAAGKSLMCLMVALFFAQLTMVIGLERTDAIVLCVTFAISSHYFWLSAFFWMNILAIDIYRTFGIGTKINDPNARSFLHYALYGLGAPALIVCTCAILSFCDCVEVDIHYASEHACWIGNGMTNLVSFGVPIVVILCSNAVLFSLTVAGVVKTRRASERMNITQGEGDASAKTRTDLILYLKLSAIMTFTWVFGFAASFSGVQFFWYPFIALNSLQGALVCLAFVCNRRVLTMWEARLKGGDGQRSGSNFSCAQKLPKTSMNEMSVVDSTIKQTKSDDNKGPDISELC